jgi:hypothetical protein
MFRTITVYRYQVVCDGCGKAAGPPQETAELALDDAVSEDFQNYVPATGLVKMRYGVVHLARLLTSAQWTNNSAYLKESRMTCHFSFRSA